LTPPRTAKAPITTDVHMMIIPALTSAILPSTTHGFFGRRGGVSTGLYDSLNAGQGSGDDPAAVETNRARIAAALGVTTLVSCYQVHSPDVVTVTAPWLSRPEADAMVTDQPGLGLCILSADCTPVLLADAGAGVIGAAHAGWKGALGGVLQATVARMIELGAQRARICAVIGPTIAQQSYEVGPEFQAAFLAARPQAAGLFVPGRGDRLHFDLPGFCAETLAREGIGAVDDLARDTCADEDDWFSNRRRNLRGEADYGRNASVIALKR
jgi:polyphenol oxidase